MPVDYSFLRQRRSDPFAQTSFDYAAMAAKNKYLMDTEISMMKLDQQQEQFEAQLAQTLEIAESEMSFRYDQLDEQMALSYAKLQQEGRQFSTSAAIQREGQRIQESQFSRQLALQEEENRQSMELWERSFGAQQEQQAAEREMLSGIMGRSGLLAGGGRPEAGPTRVPFPSQGGTGETERTPVDPDIQKLLDQGGKLPTQHPVEWEINPWGFISGSQKL